MRRSTASAARRAWRAQCRPLSCLKNSAADASNEAARSPWSQGARRLDCARAGGVFAQVQIGRRKSGRGMTAPQSRAKRVSGLITRARHPNRDDIESLKLGVPYWFMVVVLLGFASFQIWMNPFGFSDLVQRYSQDVSNLLITGPYFYGTEGRDKVSVAIVDENTLHTLH